MGLESEVREMAQEGQVQEALKVVASLPFFGLKEMVDTLANVPKDYEELRKVVIAKVAEQYKVSEALLSKMSVASIINFVRYFDRHVALFNAIPQEVLSFVDAIGLESGSASDVVMLYKDFETPHMKMLAALEIAVSYNGNDVKARLKLYKYEDGETSRVYDVDLQPGGAIPMADVLLHYLYEVPKDDP